MSQYSTLVNPEVKIDWYVTKLTGITNKMVANAPLFKDVAKEIYELTKGKIFVAHDVDFDYKFLILGYLTSDRKCNFRSGI